MGRRSLRKLFCVTVKSRIRAGPQNILFALGYWRHARRVLRDSKDAHQPFYTFRLFCSPFGLQNLNFMCDSLASNISLIKKNMQQDTESFPEKGPALPTSTTILERPPTPCAPSTSEDIGAVVKFVIIFLAAVVICVISLLNPNDILRSRNQFKLWYNQYRYQFASIARDNCTDEYSVYLYGARHNTSDQTLSGAGKFTLFVQPMIYCLLDNAGNYIQYQLATSQVVLGITPTMIALLGASSEEVCLLALIGRRRILGYLLAAASPSVYTERAFKYQDADKIIEELEYTHVRATVFRKPRALFVVLEYMAVIGSIANIAVLNWQLGLRSVNAINPNIIVLPALWSCLGIATHLGGLVVFNMRTRRLDNARPASAYKNKFQRLQWLFREIWWLPENPEDTIRFTNRKETRCFTFLAWVFSLLTIFHIILGTLILSSTNFVGPKDAFGIMTRYILSAVICRVVLVYEFSVLGLKYEKTE